MSRVAMIFTATLLSACASLTPAPQSIADAEKALTLAHLAYDGAGLALKNAATSGLLQGADAAHAKTLYDEAGTALAAADSADALTNADGVLAALADADTLLAQVRALIPKS